VGQQPKKLTVGFKKLAWGSNQKTYREVQKVSVGQELKKLAWGSNQKNLP